MHLLPRSRRSNLMWMWGISLFVLLLKALFLFTTPALWLATTTWIIDDAFIEMGVARNIAIGLGFSYDGVHATTGSPFLWTYLIALPHLIFAKELAIQTTFFIAAIFGALACSLTYLLALRISGRTVVAWTAFALALLSGNAFLNAMNGLDTSLFTFLVVLTVACYFDVGRPQQWPSWAWGSVTGLALGLAIMTRADGIFLLAPIGLLGIMDIVRSGRRLERKRVIGFLVGLSVVVAACLAIYLGWQWARTGLLSPANQVGRRELALSLHGFSFEHFSWTKYLKIVAWNIFQLESLIRIAIGSSLLGFFALIYGLFRPELRRFSMLVLLYAGLFFLVLVAYQWYFPDFHGLRYLNPFAHLTFVAIAATLWSLPENKYRPVGVICMTLAIVILAGYLHYQMASRFRWSKEQSYVARPTAEQLAVTWDTIDWMRENLPKGTVIGVRDHGRTALFSDLPIQDLAGNIDPSVPFHVKERTLTTYLKSRNVEYMLIPDLSQRSDLLYQVIFDTFVLDKVSQAPQESGRGLYRINWNETLPASPTPLP